MEIALPPGTEERARHILGLEDPEREPFALPMRAEHLWRAENFARTVPYTGSFLLPVGAKPDIGALSGSLAAVIRRHNALHSRLALRDGRAVMLPERRGAGAFQVTKVNRADIAAYRDNRPGSPLTEFFTQPIDLLEQTGFHARAFEDETGEVSLGVLIHHYFGDAWSSQILRREIEALYADAAAILPPVTQYSDYALFQRRSLADNLGAHLAYWHQRFHDAPPSRMPFDTKGEPDKLGRAYFLVGKDVTAALIALAREERISLGVIGFAAFQLALGRWCGVGDIVSATQNADRIRPQFRSTVGYLLAAIAIRSRLDADRPFREFLKSFARELYNGIAHQELGFELYDEIFVPPQPFSTPRFNFTPRQENFFVGDNESATPDIVGLQPVSDIRKISAYRDLQFLVVEYPDGLVGRVVYNKDLSFESISALVEIYQRILAGVIADRTIGIGALA